MYDTPSSASRASTLRHVSRMTRARSSCRSSLTCGKTRWQASERPLSRSASSSLCNSVIHGLSGGAVGETEQAPQGRPLLRLCERLSGDGAATDADAYAVRRSPGGH